MHTVTALPFDPVCGSPLPPLYEANPFTAGGYTYYFCSAMCRRFFIDQRQKTAPGAPETPAGSASAGEEETTKWRVSP